MYKFNYCPVVWIFASKYSLSKFEGIQKRAPRFVLDDYTSDYVELLDKANVPGMEITHDIVTFGYWGLHMYQWHQPQIPQWSFYYHGT